MADYAKFNSAVVAPMLPVPISETYPIDLFKPGLTPGNGPHIFFAKRDPTNENTPSRDNETAKYISLYMPPEIKVTYGAHWEELQMTISQYADIATGDAKAFIDAIDNFKPNSEKNVAAARALIKSAVGGAANIIDYSANTTFRAQADQILKQTPNPHMAMMFKGVEFRTFPFTFQMMARNAEESVAIRAIIKSFKAAMHPAVDEANTRFWVYPDTFNITLYSPDEFRPSPYLFQIKNAVLEHMSVDYAGSGIPSFFGENGAPVDIRMTLQFKELSELTREMIIEGY